MPATNELRNAQLNRIPVPVRSVSISNGVAKPSPVPMSTYDSQTVGRSKKVQFSESSGQKNEKTIDRDGDGDGDGVEIDRNNRAKSPAVQLASSGADTKPKATKEGKLISPNHFRFFNFLKRFLLNSFFASCDSLSRIHTITTTEEHQSFDERSTHSRSERRHQIQRYDRVASEADSIESTAIVPEAFVAHSAVESAAEIADDRPGEAKAAATNSSQTSASTT